MFEKAEQSGESFYCYNAVTANCQRFISVLMQAGGITGTDIFVMQDATQLIKNSGLRRVAAGITDAAALAERSVCKINVHTKKQSAGPKIHILVNFFQYRHFGVSLD